MTPNLYDLVEQKRAALEAKLNQQTKQDSNQEAYKNAAAAGG
jgi:hypothetical protein